MKLIERTNRKFLIRTIVLLILILLTVSIFAGSIPQTQETAEATTIDFEFYLTCNGLSQIPLADISSNLTGTTNKYMTVNLYASAVSAASYDVCSLTGSLYYDKTIFSIPAESSITSATTYDEDSDSNIADWVVSYGPLEAETGRSQLGLIMNDRTNITIGQDRLICSIKFKLVSASVLPTEDSKIAFDFDDSYNPGQAYISRDPGDGGDYYYYFAAESDDWSNITCTPLYLGEITGGDPSADLASLSLKDTAATTEYIQETFAAATTSYTTWNIPYTDSVSGMQLAYTMASSSATVGVTFNSGSAASIDANNIITGVVNGDQIIIAVSDDGGTLTNTYTITASVTAISADADLSSLTAKTGTTSVSFVETFNKDTLTYTLNIPYTKTEVTLTAAKSSTFATLKIDSTVATTKTFTGLAVGTTSKVVQVTAQNGTVKNYTVNIVRTAASANTDLASITVNSNSVEMGTGVVDYTYTVAEATTTYQFAIVGAEPTTQTVAYQISGGGYTVMASGGNSGTLRSIAKNQSVLVDIRVTAQDGTIKYYTLTITRAASTNTELDSVTVTESSTTYTLTPAGTVYTYTIGTSGATQITVTATPKTGENATVRILDSSSNVVTSGIIAISSLAAGTYAYSIEVTPQDTGAAVQLYTLNIIKKSSAKELFTPVVTHTNNSGENIEGITYDAATYTYTLSIAYELNEIVVNDIRALFTASANSSIANASWADLKTGTPQAGLPVSYADITFNSSTTVQYLNRDIYVTAEDGSVQQYEIQITRLAASTDNALTSLSVGGSTVDGFTPATLIYNTAIIFDGSTESVNVYGEPSSQYSTVTYNGASNGQINLTRGVLTTVNVNVTAQSGAVRTYTIKVIAANNDNTISNIELLKSDSTVILGISFDAGNVGPYNITVPYTISVVTIKVTTPTSAASTVYGGGTKTITVSTNSFTVYAVSEAGVKGLEYTINITRNVARTTKTLDSLTISSTSVTNYISSFISSTTIYDIRVDRAVTSLNVAATVPSDNGSSITSGLTSSFTWTGTSATIYIEVTAEDATKQTYTVNVTRANDNYVISDIDVDVQAITYNAATTDYTLNAVAYSQSSMTFNVDLSDATYGKLYVKVNTGATTLQSSPDSFSVALATGANTISIYAESDYGTKGTTYKFYITRNVASTNARLSDLEIIASGSDLLTGNDLFYSDTVLYEVRVNNNISSITINATQEYANATISISPTTRTLISGLNTFYITVTAENGTTQLTYEVRVTRANDVNEISNIQVTGQTFTYAKATTAYSLTTVGYSTTSINYNVTLLDTSAKLYAKINTGSYNQMSTPADFDTALITGTNTISIYVVSEYGTQGSTYVFTIIRSVPSTNAKLSALAAIANSADILTGANAFNANTTLYAVRVDNTVGSVAINATAQDTKATVAITPSNLNLASGLNTFYVTVTAEDGTTKITYEIRITKANDINDITNIQITGQTFTYDDATTAYTLTTVGYTTTSINFNVTLSDTSAKVYAKINTGSYSQMTTPADFSAALVTGINTISVYAVSEYGTQGSTYVFTIERSVPSTNAKLSALTIIANSADILTGTNAFNADTTLYAVRVDNTVISIAINATAQDSKATVAVTPSNFNLASGLNTYYATVTAEDGTTKLIYEMRINRANDNNVINNIAVDLQTITYNAAQISYALDSVVYSTQTAYFNVTMQDASAKVYAKVNTGSATLQTDPTSIAVSLVTGNNTITIYAVSEYGTQGSNYVFTVTRDMAGTNAQLSALAIIAGGSDILTGANAFDTNTYLYQVRVNNDIASITINATLADSKAKLAITPTSRTLSSGANIYYITVTAEDTTTQQTYEVRITRANDVNTIDNIEVDIQAITYEAAQLSYALNAVAYSISTAAFNVTLQDTTAKLYAKVNTGAYSLVSSPDSLSVTLITGSNTVSLYAVSEYGTQGSTYVFTVTRNVAGTNAKLSDLEVMAGGSDLLTGTNAFDADTTLYVLRVDNTITSIAINPIAQDTKASVTINPTNFNLASGLNTYYVTVKAEDGTTQVVYELRITKANDVNDIDNIVVSTQTISYSAAQTTYALDPVAYNVASINFNVTLRDTSAKFYVKVNTSAVKLISSPEDFDATLVSGINTISLYAVSEFGTQGSTYVFTVTKNVAGTNAKLSDLEIIAGGSDILTGANAFDADTTLYTLRVDNSVSSVTINATTQDTKASVAITPSNFNLASGLNTYYATVTAEDGTTKIIYEMRITRANDINSITDIDVDVQAISYVDTTTSYALNAVAYSIKTITFNVVLADSTAKLYSKLNTAAAKIQSTPEEFTITLASGVNTIQIYAVSEFGTTGVTYQFSISQNAASTDVTLSSLSAVAGGSELLVDGNAFYADVMEYNVRVNNTVTSVVITAIPSHSYSTVSVTPTGGSLALGKNTFYITVTAESGAARTYTVNITRANDNNIITGIKVNGTAITLDPDAPIVLPNVAYTVNSIILTATLADSSATLYGTGTKTLVDGTQYFEVYAISQYGLLTGITKDDVTVYVIELTRTPVKTDNKLEALTITDNASTPLAFDSGITFDPLRYTYTITLALSSTLTEVIINAVAATNNKTLSGDTGLQTLTVNGDGTISEQFTVIVTAENGSTQNYTVNILKGTTLSSDASIQSVTLKDSGSNEYMSFNSTVAKQSDVNIPYTIAGLTLTVTPTNSKATVSGTYGYIAVVAGGTTYVQFKVIAEDGTEGTYLYNFNIIRAAVKTDKYLDTLTVKDINDSSVDFMSGIFTSATTNYNLRVDDDVANVVITATVPANNGSTIISTLQASYALTSGATTVVTIYVQAEDGSTNYYTLNIKRANNDNAIDSITIGSVNVPVENFTLVGTSYEYTLSPNVIYSVTTMEIAVILENGAASKATVTGAGIKSLALGNNNFTVYATAQDGTVGSTYIVRIYREAASSDASLKSLKITTNTSVILLNVTSNVLTSYTLQTDRSVTDVVVEAVKNHSGASVSGDKGNVTVDGGVNNVLKIYVTSEDDTVKTYTINIEVKDAANNIANITADIATIDFAAATYTYDLGSVAYSVDEIAFGVTLGSAYSTLYVNSAVVASVASVSKALSVGLNTFVFYAISERGVKGQEYTVTVTRTAADSNNYLSSLVVRDNNNATLSYTEGVFNRLVQSYTIVLASTATTTYVDISAVAENGSTPTGTGVKTLVAVAGVISNTFTVTVTAENGEVRNYTVTVIKSQSTEISEDNTISDISLIGNGQEYLKTIFNAAVAVQTAITVPYDVESVYLSITANSKATVTGAGLYNIAEGETVTITFQVTAENNVAGLLYSVDVTREIASEENELEELYYEIEGVITYLDTLDDTFTINVDVDTTGIVIGGTAPESATVTGLGEFTLINSTTTKVINVTAENGEVKTYVLTIIKQSDDATIKSILLDGTEILLNFVNNQYQAIVPYLKTSIAILATPTNINATIIGNGSYTLSEGQNQFVVYAVAEAGNKGIEYTVKLTRQVANTNSNLASLTVLNNANSDTLLLQPAFSTTTTKYTVDLTDYPTISEILIQATAESAKVQSIQGTGVFTLKTALGESSEIFSVTVTAEDGSATVYDITVIRNVKPEDDITVNTLSFIGSDAVNYLGTATNALTQFVLSTKTYSITLPYKVKNATLTIINNNGATVYGNGNYVLTSNRIIEFYMVSQSGLYTSDTYVIEVIKELPSDDNTLSDLTINGVTVENFDPEVTGYEMTVSYEDVTSVQIGATANDANASVIGDLGNISLSAGVNTINITVTAEDGTSKTYSITISRLSNDNSLLYLGVTGYTIAPVFVASTYSYTLSVPYTVEMVNVEAVANAKATITGAGHKTLAIGQNTMQVYVTSEQGVIGYTYTLVITKETPSDDNTLKSLSVLSGVDSEELVLQPTFRADITDYIIELDSSSGINTLNILAQANCPYAKGVGGTGYKILKTTVDGLYNNVFEIIVMAQDGTTRTYTVSVYRDVALADDITIGSLSLMGSDGVNYLGTSDAVSSFQANIYTYNIVVPYYVESVTLAISTLTATAYGTGQKMFGDENRVTFTAYLVSQSGAVVSNNYNIIVNRTLAVDDNTLKNIKVNGSLIDGFSSGTYTYEIDIPYLTTDKIIISAEPNSPTADIISGIGTFDLQEGRNVFSILVRAENGDTSSYNLVINYMNNNSLLESLNLQGALDTYIDEDNAIAYPFTFIPDTLTYVVTVDKDVQIVNLKGQAQDQNRAAIIGLGKYVLTEDRTTIVINVIAADNTTTSTYTVNILKTVLPSSNTRLKDLSIDGYQLTFDPTYLSYSINVDSGTETLDISAITEDPNATATIIGNSTIEVGQNIVLVQVEAEDGTISYYQLSVNKEGETDYFLTIMLILIFLLLLLLILYKLISNNKEKYQKKDLTGFKINNNNDPIDLNNIGEETKKWQT